MDLIIPSLDKDKGQLGGPKLSRDILASFQIPKEKKGTLLPLPSLHQKMGKGKENKRGKGTPLRKSPLFLFAQVRLFPLPWTCMGHRHTPSPSWGVGGVPSLLQWLGEGAGSWHKLT